MGKEFEWWRKVWEGPFVEKIEVEKGRTRREVVVTRRTKSPSPPSVEDPTQADLPGSSSQLR